MKYYEIENFWRANKFASNVQVKEEEMFVLISKINDKIRTHRVSHRCRRKTTPRRCRGKHALIYFIGFE